MLKKITYITIFILLLVSLAIWSPWDRYDWSFGRLIGVAKVENKAGLEVYSLMSEIEVYLDDVFIKTINVEEPLIIENEIEPGIHQVTLKRKLEDQNAEYFILKKSVNFLNDFNVVLAYELGPTKEFSQGHVFYARKGSQIDQNSISKLNIFVPEIEHVSVLLDGQEIGKAPISQFEISLDKIHMIKFQKDGYESLDFTILPEDQDSRSKLSTVDLYLEVDLFLMPFEIKKDL